MFRTPRFLIQLLLSALLLRAVALGAHALWLDEGATWAWAVRDTWGGTLFAEANHPPAWWLITRAWISLFGDSEVALRMPAALFGVLTVWLGWRLALRLLDPRSQPTRGGFRPKDAPFDAQRTALWFAGLLTVSAFLTEYAQEARMYALLIAEALGLALLYLRWLDTRSRGTLVAYALLGALSLYTHYFALWVLAGHGVHALWLAWRARGTPERFSPWPIIVALFVAGVLFAPWAAYLVGNYESISTGGSYEPFGRLGYVLWRIGAGGGLVVVDRARQQQGIEGTIEDEMLWILITGVLWVLPLIAGVMALRKRPGVQSFVSCSVLVPIGCCLAVFPFFQLIHERYLVFLAPWLIFLAIVGARSARPLPRLVLTTALCVLFGIGALAYHGASILLIPQGASAGPLEDKELYERHGVDQDDALTWLHNGHPYGKEPWRNAQAFVKEHSREGDMVLLHPAYLHLVWDYYDRKRLPRLLLPGGKALTSEAFDEKYGESLNDATRVFLVLAHEETKHPDDYVQVVRTALGLRWGAQEMERFQSTEPIWFDRSWGVRVAVFNRRLEGE